MLQKIWRNKKHAYICTRNAEVAQLVELQPSKLVVASSSLVFRSKPKKFLGFFITFILLIKTNQVQTCGLGKKFDNLSLLK